MVEQELEQKEINKIRGWSSFQQWENHKKFFEENKEDIGKLLNYVLELLDKRRAFRYNWIYRCHKIALGVLLKN